MSTIPYLLLLMFGGALGGALVGTLLINMMGGISVSPFMGPFWVLCILIGLLGGYFLARWSNRRQS